MGWISVSQVTLAVEFTIRINSCQNVTVCHLSAVLVFLGSVIIYGLVSSRQVDLISHRLIYRSTVLISICLRAGGRAVLFYCPGSKVN